MLSVSTSRREYRVLFPVLIASALVSWCLVIATGAEAAPVATGVITTIAGNGTTGVAGDGGPATAAQLVYPAGAAVDAAGNVYIADTNNHRIRKVTAATGVITTVAGTGVAGFLGDGGAATSARLYFLRISRLMARGTCTSRTSTTTAFGK